MKAVAKVQPGYGAELIERASRAPGPGEVRLKIEAAAICGSDVHVYEWNARVASSSPPLPLVMGHEYCATVMAVGEGVANLQPGDRVAGETHLPCGVCRLCRLGKQHICQNLRIVGRHIDGCFADEMTVPAICTYKLPVGFPTNAAAVLEPLGCAVRPLLDEEVAGSTVVVLGAGPIGLFAVAGARALGAAEVVATNRSRFRLELASQMGATRCVNPAEEDAVAAVLAATGGDGADIVLESSGNVEAVVQGVRMLRKGGTLLLVGLPSAPVQLNLASDVILKELTVKGFHGREMFRTWEKVVPMVAQGLIPTEPVITHQMALADYAQGFELMIQRQAGKVLLLP